MYERNDSKYAIYSKFQTKDDYIEMLEAAIDLTVAGFVLTDDEGNVLRMNPAHKKVSGYEPESMMGKNLGEIDKVDPTPSATMRVIRSKKAIVEEQYCYTGRNMMTYSVPYFDDEGRIKFVINTLLDTTEVNETKKELRKNIEVNSELNLRIALLEEQIAGGTKIICNSKVMKDLIETSFKIAQYDSTVLITGESGVGKEVLASYVHEHSLRSNGPYIKINCASIPIHLMESELFGYDPGAFTGAHSKGKVGLIELADGGTLLLDEVTEMPVELQAKFLRVIQEGEFYRVGGKEVIKADVRIIAASNKDLLEMVRQGSFREDLFYRLNVVPLTIPPLRERVEDIPVLIDFFVQQFNSKYDASKVISNDVINIMVQREYKGNIRELWNIVERLLLLSGDKVELVDYTKLFPHIPSSQMEFAEGSLKSILEHFEKDVLKQYYAMCNSESKMAIALKTNQSTISRKMRKYDLIK